MLGRSFFSDQLVLEVKHEGPCREECEGMESLGMFTAFGARATNTGTFCSLVGIQTPIIILLL